MKKSWEHTVLEWPPIQNMELSNFSIMTLSVCGIVTLNVYFTEYFIRRKSRSKDHKMIDFPDFFHSLFRPIDDEKGAIKKMNNGNEELNNQSNYAKFLFFNSLYFVFMFMLITLLHQYAVILLIVQHCAVIGVILLNFLQFGKPSRAVPLTILYGFLWLSSVNTNYRWMLNNTIVIMCILLTGYIRFKNFIYLQIFMWLAFVYDVYMLSGIHLGNGLQFFSVRETTTVPLSVQNTDSDELCKTLLCHVFNHDNNFKIPTAFSIQFGSKVDHVFIGTGDIMFGAFVANFASRFFKKPNYVAFTVFAFGGAVGLLSHVATNAPFPALLTIVPICTLALMVLALWSNKSMELLLDCEKSECRTIRKNSEELVLKV